jgi:hypothetical protein
MCSRSRTPAETSLTIPSSGRSAPAGFELTHPSPDQPHGPLFGGSEGAEPLAGLLDRDHGGMHSAGDLRVRTVGGPPHFEIDDRGGAEPSALLKGQVQRAYSGVRRQLTPTMEADWTLMVQGPVGRKPTLLVVAMPVHLDAAIAASPAQRRFWLAHGHREVTHGGRNLGGVRGCWWQPRPARRGDAGTCVRKPASSGALARQRPQARPRSP